MNSISTSKFIKILGTFNISELNAFEKWLASPWCNSNKNLMRLVEILRRHHPDYSSMRLTKEKLFAKVLPKGKYSSRQMNNLLSKAYLAAESFVVFEHLNKNPGQQLALITQEMQKRGLDDWFFKTTDIEISNLEAQSVLSWEEELRLYTLHRQVYLHPSRTARMITGSPTIVKMGKQIDLVYLLERATIINEKISRNRVLNKENHDIQLELKKWYKACEGVEHPSLGLYKSRFEYSFENIHEKYWDVRETYFNVFNTLNDKEKIVHLLSLINDHSLLAKSGKAKLADILPLFKFGLETGLLLNKGILSYRAFLMMVSISNVIGKFEFAKEVVGKYIKNLRSIYREDAIHWANGHSAFYQGDYEKAMSFIQYYDFQTFSFVTISKVLKAQLYFEIHIENETYQTLLFNFLETFERWLQRDKVRSSSGKLEFLNFIQAIRTIANFYTDPNVNIDRIDKLLLNLKKMQGREWIVKKIKQLQELKSNK